MIKLWKSLLNLKLRNPKESLKHNVNLEQSTTTSQKAQPFVCSLSLSLSLSLFECVNYDSLWLRGRAVYSEPSLIMGTKAVWANELTKFWSWNGGNWSTTNDCRQFNIHNNKVNRH